MEQQNIAPGFLNINSDVETMSSCDTADLTGKQHAHVKRDIENMCIQMKWDVSKFGDIYIGAKNREQTEFRAEIVKLDNKKREDRASLYSMAILMELKSAQ